MAIFQASHVVRQSTPPALFSLLRYLGQWFFQEVPRHSHVICKADVLAVPRGLAVAGFNKHAEEEEVASGAWAVCGLGDRTVSKRPGNGWSSVRVLLV